MGHDCGKFGGTPTITNKVKIDQNGAFRATLLHPKPYRTYHIKVNILTFLMCIDYTLDTSCYASKFSYMKICKNVHTWFVSSTHFLRFEPD